jgi:hypothetical protein
MSAMPPHPADVRGTRSFFALLAAATALPYLLFPLCLRVVPDVVGSGAAVQACLFLGAGGHVAASFFFYDRTSMRSFMVGERPLRFVAAPLLVLAVAASIFGLGSQAAKNIAVVAFWIWQVHHFTRQNHGILAFASRASGVPVRSAERTAITLTDVAAILATLCFVTPYRDTVLGPWGWHIYATGLGVYCCAWLAYLATAPWRDVRTAPARALTLLALMGFYAPLFVFANDPFSAVFIYLTAHGLQYLVFMGYVTAAPKATRLRAVTSLIAWTLVGGGVIKLMRAPAAWGSHADLLLGLSYGVVMWHFVLDAGVWRLSEPFQRSYMAERFAFLRPARSPS